MTMLPTGGPAGVGTQPPARGLEPDTQPRVLEVPSDLARELARNVAAQAAFEKLSYSNKQRYVLPIEAAKTSETRERRIVRAVAELTGGQS